MGLTLVLTLFLSVYSRINAQNLVPNPSFEEYSICPDGTSQIDRATHWMPFRHTPDYHNACDESEIVGVPNSIAADGAQTFQQHPLSHE
jgi:hypothetical protein